MQNRRNARDEIEPLENGYRLTTQRATPPHLRQTDTAMTPHPTPEQWLHVRVFYIRLSSRAVHNYGSTTPNSLTLYHVPSDRHTLLEINSKRANLCSEGSPAPAIFLKRDRLNNKTDEVTFVSTDSVRVTGSVRFEVFNANTLVLSGALEMGCGGVEPWWGMRCKPVGLRSTEISRGWWDQPPPDVEVYVAGSFSGNPIVLSNNLEVGWGKKKQIGRGMLECVPENEVWRRDDRSSTLTFTARDHIHTGRKLDGEGNSHRDIMYLEDDDGELSWFNAGVRVGFGIGLGLCLGVGIGVGLLLRTYKGPTRNFVRHIM